MGMEISLFKRLYMAENAADQKVSKVMLNVQYRMHPQISEFPSREFYEGRLRADISCHERRLPIFDHGFPWPAQQQQQQLAAATLSRCVFVPCLGLEDSGYQSKGNTSQAELCKRVYQLLTASEPTTASIAVLTPYTRQIKILQSLLPVSATVSSIDGFQGREADIIIFVTVRSNLHGEIGFLSDLRRLNVVLTRARAGLIVIGCPRTLADETVSEVGYMHPGQRVDAYNVAGGLNQAVDRDSTPVWRRLIASLAKVDNL
jgi:regulator of nonsense transcripts 1